MTKHSGKDYNGYKNYSSWNVSLWIFNDEPLYRAMINFMKYYKGKAPYKEFIYHMNLGDCKTPDGINWISKHIDYKMLNDELKESVL